MMLKDSAACSPPSSDVGLERFRSVKNLSLASRKRDGSWIASPVWFAILDEQIYVVTVAGSAKSLRISNDPQIMIAPCTRFRGRLTGDAVAASARLVPLDRNARAHRAVTDRYGVQSRIFQWQNRRKGVEMILIEIALEPSR